MAKTRLNQNHRSMLTAFAEKAIECKAEQKARDKAYERAEAAVVRCIEKQFPPADMQVLKKYAVASDSGCVNGGDPNGAYVRFNFDDDRVVPLRPGYGYRGGASVSFDAKAKELIDVYALAEHALTEARNRKLGDYEALIRTAVSYEDVLDVWPAAAVLSEKIRRQQTALVVLSSDLIATIRADNAGAKMEASEIAV